MDVSCRCTTQLTGGLQTPLRGKQWIVRTSQGANDVVRLGIEYVGILPVYPDGFADFRFVEESNALETFHHSRRANDCRAYLGVQRVHCRRAAPRRNRTSTSPATYLASEPGCPAKGLWGGDARRNELPTCATAGSDKLRTAAARNHL